MCIFVLHLGVVVVFVWLYVFIYCYYDMEGTNYLTGLSVHDPADMTRITPAAKGVHYSSKWNLVFPF